MKRKELIFARVQKSSEGCENKELESGCKRREIRSKLGIVGIHPGRSRKSGKHGTCRIRKNERVRKLLKAKTGIRGVSRVICVYESAWMRRKDIEGVRRTTLRAGFRKAPPVESPRCSPRSSGPRPSRAKQAGWAGRAEGFWVV